jgi:hypothetical protein
VPSTASLLFPPALTLIAMPKGCTNAGANSHSYQPYPLSFSRRSDDVPDGRTEVSRSASGVQIPQHQLSSSRPIEVGPSSGGLTRGSSLYNAYPQPPQAHPSHLRSCAGPPPTPTPSYPPNWNSYPDLCNDGTIEGSTALFQPPPRAPRMIDVAPQLQRPTDCSLQWGNEQAVEPWLYNAQCPLPLPSSMSLDAGPSSSPPSVFTAEAPLSNYSFFPGANNFQMRDVHFTIKGPSDQGVYSYSVDDKY